MESGGNLDDVYGIVYVKNGKTIFTRPRPKIKNLDDVPFPARNLLPMSKYYSFISRYKNYAILMSSRGCTFSCSFCEQRTGDIRYRSPKNVVDEIEECTTEYGVKEIYPIHVLDEVQAVQGYVFAIDTIDHACV